MLDDNTDYANCLEDDLQHEFLDAPFVIFCIDSLAELDATFGEEQVNISHDNRADRSNYHYDDIPADQLNKYNNYTRVFALNGKPITLRDVLKALYLDDHYKKEKVSSDPHQFMEGSQKSDKSVIQFEIIWGS